SPILTRVNGAGAVGSPCASGYSTNGFPATGTFSDTGPAVRLTIAPAVGYQLNVTNFTFQLRRSPAGAPSLGPNSCRIAYSVDGGSTWINNGSNLSPGTSATCSIATALSWNVSDFSTTGTLLVQIFGFSSSGATGELQIRNFNIEGTVTVIAIPGCTDSLACNFNPDANSNDGSCNYPGCMDSGACNFNPIAGCDDGSCVYASCLDPLACNYLSCSDAGCHYIGMSCNDGNDSTQFDIYTDCETCEGSVQNLESPFLGFSVTEIELSDSLAALIDAALPINGPEMPKCYRVSLCFSTSNWELRSLMGGADYGPWELNTATSFYQHPMGGVTFQELNPNLFESIPTLQYDSWFTIGGWNDSNLISYLPSEPDSPFIQWENTGSSFVENSSFGSAVFGLWTNPNSQGMPDDTTANVLIAQIVTDSNFELTVNALFRKLNADGTLFLPVTTAIETGLIISSEDSPIFCTIFGCIDPEACNFNWQANTNDGSCTYPGCLDASASNYDPLSGCPDSSCIYPGCTSTEACNYQPDAWPDDGSCIFPGCTDPTANNYDATSGCDDGSCTYSGCEGDIAEDGMVNIGDLILLLSQFGGCFGVGCSGDLNLDGAVNTSDFLLFASYFGTTCGPG
ncbi:MAG: hypothetical protein JNM00_15610, partial [Flavobacteriales bacterium]|nr:hypothetical protein [Flavobacteriales bacterium]